MSISNRKQFLHTMVRFWGNKFAFDSIRTEKTHKQAWSLWKDLNIGASSASGFGCAQPVQLMSFVYERIHKRHTLNRWNTHTFRQAAREPERTDEQKEVPDTVQGEARWICSVLKRHSV